MSLILFEDKFAAAVLTTTGASPTLPVQNLQDPQPRQIARWNATSCAIEADLGASLPVGMVVVHATNLTAAATRRLRLATSQANLTASPLHDSGVAAAGADPRYAGSFAIILAADVTARWLRLDIADASLAFIDLGLVLAGSPLRTQRAAQFGWSIGYDEFGFKTRGPVGTIHVRRAGRARRLELPFDFASEADAMAGFLELDRLAGAVENVAVAPFPGGSRDAAQLVVGVVAGMSTIAQAQLNIWQKRIVVEERL